MLTTTVEPGTNLVIIGFSGTLDADEMIACRTQLEAVQREHGSLRLLAQYGDIDMRKIAPRALWEDLKNIPLIRHIDKCAIIAHQDWVRKISEIATPVLPCELRTFKFGEDAAAREWLEA